MKRLAEAYRELSDATGRQMRPEEIAALGELAGDAAAAAARQIHELHTRNRRTSVAPRRPRRPPRQARPRPDRARRLFGGQRVHAVGRPRRRPRGQPRPVARRPVDRAHAGRAPRGQRAQRRLRRHAGAAAQPPRAGDGGPASRPRPRTDRLRAAACLPERQAAARRVRARPVRDRRRLEAGRRPPRPVRAPDGDRAWLHAGVPALQHRPSHLRERARAGRGCSRGWSRSGRFRFTKSCWSGTRWAVWSPAAPATTARTAPAWPRSVTCSRSARRTAARRWSRRPTRRAPRWPGCRRPAPSPAH